MNQNNRYYQAPPPGRFYTPIAEAVDPSLYTYNSDSIVPAYHQNGPKPIAARFIDDLDQQFSGAKEVNSTYLTREISPADISAQQNRNVIQYAVQPDPVLFPGFVPKMKSVAEQDFSIPMRESFSLLDKHNLADELEQDRKQNKKSNPHTQTCIDFLNHVKSCPLCQRYFHCDNRMFYTIILSIIIIFAIILYFITKDCGEHSSNNVRYRK